MNIFKKLAKDPEPEEFLDDEYDTGYYDEVPKNEELVTDDAVVEEVSTVEEVVEEPAEMREPQPMPKKPIAPAKPAVKYYAPAELADRHIQLYGRKEHGRTGKTDHYS